jgi:hypothetical protein
MRHASRAIRCAGALLMMAVTAGTAAWAQDATMGAAGAKAESRIRLLREYRDSVKVDGKDEVRYIKLYFDYTAGVTRQTVQDAKGVLIEDKILEGQPRPTDEEFAEAIAIVRADRIVGGMLARVKAVPDGGFSLVEGEGKACGPRSRCVHVFWLSPDRVGLVRWTVVDLVKQTIAYRAYRAPDETTSVEEVSK